MARRRGRKGGRRYFGRRARRSVGRALTMGPRMFGFTKSGFKASRAIMAGSALATTFVPAYGNESAISQIFKTQPLESKIKGALACMLWTGLGWNVPALSGNTTGKAETKAICGMGVAAGAGLAIAGKMINPMLRGSPVKL